MFGEVIFVAVVMFWVIWAAVFMGTRAALRSFFQREYYDLEADGSRSNDDDRGQ